MKMPKTKILVKKLMDRVARRPSFAEQAEAHDREQMAKLKMQRDGWKVLETYVQERTSQGG